MKNDKAFSLILITALVQIVLVAALWGFGAYTVYKILQHFGIF